MDLAYRGVVPRALSAMLGERGSESDAEEYATIRDSALAQAEAQARQRARSRLSASVNVCTALLLGIRRLRADYQERVQSLSALWKVQFALDLQIPA